MDDIRQRIKRFPFLTMRKTWPYQFEGTLIYSFLCYRAAAGLGAGKKATAHGTLLNYRTVTARLEDLAKAGLIKKADGKWFAMEPQGDVRSHFSVSPRPGKHWSMALQSYPFLLPSQRLSLRAAAVLSLLGDLGRKTNGVVRGTCYKHLALLLGMSARTVRRSLKELCGSGLVKVFLADNDKARFAVLATRLQEEHLAFFIEKGKEEELSYQGLDEAVAAQEEQAQFRYDNPRVETAHQWLLSHKVAPKDAEEIMELFFACWTAKKLNLEAFHELIASKAEYAQKQHAEGKSVEHPTYLIRSHLTKLLGPVSDSKPASVKKSKYRDEDDVARFLKCDREEVVKAGALIDNAYEKLHPRPPGGDWETKDWLKNVVSWRHMAFAKLIELYPDMDLAQFKAEVSTVVQNMLKQAGAAAK